MPLALLSVLSCAGSGVADLRLCNGEIRVIAHRGGTGPDGTVAGCLRSLDAGVVFLELDVRLTRDGRAVILHDATVDRTTDGKGAVDQFTLEDLQRLDAGSRYEAAYAGERIPTVEELLRAVGRRGVVLLELKVAEAAMPVVEAIGLTGAFDRAVVRTADPALLRRLLAAEPRVMTGTMAAVPGEDGLAVFVSGLSALGVRAFTPLQNGPLTRAAVTRLQAAGIAVWGTNTNDPEVWTRLIDAGVDGIISDRPAPLRAAIERR